MLCHEKEHIQIDELKVCYTAEAGSLNELMSMEIGSYLELHGYRFHRIVSDRFRYYYEVWDDDGLVAQLKFGLYTDLSENKHYVYFKVSNHVLYRPSQLKTILELPNVLGLVFNNYEKNAQAQSPEGVPSSLELTLPIPQGEGELQANVTNAIKEIISHSRIAEELGEPEGESLQAIADNYYECFKSGVAEEDYHKTAGKRRVSRRDQTIIFHLR